MKDCHSVKRNDIFGLGARRNPSGGVSPCAAILEENIMKPMSSTFTDSEFGEGAILSYLEHECPDIALKLT